MFCVHLRARALLLVDAMSVHCSAAPWRCGILGEAVFSSRLTLVRGDVHLLGSMLEYADTPGLLVHGVKMGRGVAPGSGKCAISSDQAAGVHSFDNW